RPRLRHGRAGRTRRAAPALRGARPGRDARGRHPRRDARGPARHGPPAQGDAHVPGAVRPDAVDRHRCRRRPLLRRLGAPQPQRRPGLLMVTERLAAYVAEAGSLPLPPEVEAKAKHHLLDTVAAMLSGTELKPGRLALAYAERQGGAPEALVLGSGALTNVTTAALVNGMLAHGDETGDAHAPAVHDPGGAAVPAALSMADKMGSSGEALLRAVALGYDVCTRTNLAIGTDVLKRTQRSTYSISGAFGAMAAAASLAGLSAGQVRYALSYTAQQASGLASWNRDEEHVEKAFVFAGMPVRAGVSAVDMVMAGFTGVPDVFAGETTFLGAFSPAGDMNTWVDGLGQR